MIPNGEIYYVKKKTPALTVKSLNRALVIRHVPYPNREDLKETMCIFLDTDGRISYVEHWDWVVENYFIFPLGLENIKVALLELGAELYD